MLQTTVLAPAVLPRLLVAQSPEILTESRSYIVDILIVLALFGAALLVICRSSRRV